MNRWIVSLTALCVVAISAAQDSSITSTGLSNDTTWAPAVNSHTANNFCDPQPKWCPPANNGGGQAPNCQAVPEPASMAAIGVGVAGLVRRKKAKKN